MTELRHNTRAIFHVLLKNEAATAHQIADVIGCSDSTVKKSIDELNSFGFVECIGKCGRRYVYMPIVNYDLVEYAEFDKNSNERKLKIAATKKSKYQKSLSAYLPVTIIGEGIIKQGNRITHKRLDMVMVERGRAQTVRTRSYGFASTEIII